MSARSSGVGAQPTAPPVANSTPSVSNGLPLLSLGTTALGFSNPFARKTITNDVIRKLQDYDWLGEKKEDRTQVHDEITAFVKKTIGEGFDPKNIQPLIDELNIAEDDLKKQLNDHGKLASFKGADLGKKVGSIASNLHLIKLIRTVFQSRVDKHNASTTSEQAKAEHARLNESTSRKKEVVSNQEKRIREENLKIAYHQLSMEMATAELRSKQNVLRTLRNDFQKSQTDFDKAKKNMDAAEKARANAEVKHTFNKEMLEKDLAKIYWDVLPEDLKAVFETVVTREEKRQLYVYELEQLRRRQSGEPTTEQQQTALRDDFLKLTEGKEDSSLDIPTLTKMIKDLNEKVQDEKIHEVGEQLTKVLDAKLPHRTEGRYDENNEDDF